MALRNRAEFKKIRKIEPSFAVTTSAVSKAIWGSNCTVNVISGNVWLNPLATATQENGYKLAAGSSIDLCVEVLLSFVSDATGGSVQILVYED